MLDLDANIVILRGRLSRDPEVRTLPSGSVLHRYEVTVRQPGRPAESAPVSWFDPPRAAAVGAGDPVVVVGRVRRRFYRTGGATASATDVVADQVLRPSSAASVRKAVATALGELEAGSGEA